MARAPQIRRLTGFGWSIEDEQGRVHAVRRDDGAVLPVLERLVGTRESAELVGVKPSNFVRDWASRPDFPAPVAALSSGRVWLAADIERYADARRAPKPPDARIAEIARRLAWWQSAQQTLARPLELVARVMVEGSREEIFDVERFFGRRVLLEALTKAPPGIFEARSWNYWHLVLGGDRTIPLPARRIP
jgi:hypothetical protein